MKLKLYLRIPFISIILLRLSLYTSFTFCENNFLMTPGALEIKLFNNIAFQTINDIEIRELGTGDNGYESAVDIPWSSSDPPYKLLDDVRDQLIRENWWLQEYWQKKGLPKEQINITVNNQSITIYNWRDEKLAFDQINNIAQILGIFALIANREALKKCRYILIDNERSINPNSGEEINGYNADSYDALLLYPRSLDPIDFRISGVSNLEGTVIHELTHNLVDMIFNEWVNKFDWEYLTKPRKLPGGMTSSHKIKRPERLVTDYASTNPSEDICDSMVAALKRPEFLDPERLDFLQKTLIKTIDITQRFTTKVKRLHGNSITLPSIPSLFTFKRGFKIEIIRRQRDTSL